MQFIDAEPEIEPTETVSVKIKTRNANKLRAYTKLKKGASIGRILDKILEEVWKRDEDATELFAKNPHAGKKESKQAKRQVPQPVPALARVAG